MHTEATAILALAQADAAVGHAIPEAAKAVGWTWGQLWTWLKAHPEKIAAFIAIITEFATGQTVKAIADLKALLGI